MGRVALTSDWYRNQDIWRYGTPFSLINNRLFVLLVAVAVQLRTAEQFHRTALVSGSLDFRHLGIVVEPKASANHTAHLFHVADQPLNRTAALKRTSGAKAVHNSAVDDADASSSTAAVALQVADAVFSAAPWIWVSAGPQQEAERESVVLAKDTSDIRASAGNKSNLTEELENGAGNKSNLTEELEEEIWWLEVHFLPPSLRYPNYARKRTALDVWRSFFMIKWHSTLFLFASVVTLMVWDYYWLQGHCPLAWQPLIWFGLAITLCTYIHYVFDIGIGGADSHGGTAYAWDWFKGYVYEWIFCIDDLFIFHFIFHKYHMPSAFAPKALFSCLCGQIATRFAFYLGLAHIIRGINLIHYAAGAVLIFNGIQTLCDEKGHEGDDPSDMWLIKFVERCLGGRLKKAWRDADTKRIREQVRAVQRSHQQHEAEHAAVRGRRDLHLPELRSPLFQSDTPQRERRARSKPVSSGETLLSSRQWQRQRSNSEPRVEIPEPLIAALFVRDDDGIVRATLMVPIVLCMLLTDVVLGADCTIAKIESIHGPFWNLSSSIIALFGIRSMYFWVATLADKLAYIQVGVAFVLIYIGMELVVMDFVHFGTLLSFGIIFTILSSTAIASVIFPTQETEEDKSPKVSRRHSALACFEPQADSDMMDMADSEFDASFACPPKKRPQT